MIAVILALSASLTWGAADFLGGTLSRRIAAVMVAAGSQAVGLILLLGISVATGFTFPAESTILLGCMAGICSFIGILLMYHALATGQMATVAPIIGLSSMVPLIWGVFSGDQLSVQQTCGIMAALAGIILVTRESAPNTPSSNLEFPRNQFRPIGVALISALIFGASLVFLAAGSAESPLGTTLVMRASSCMTALILVLFIRPSGHFSRRSLLLIALVGVLDVSAYTAFSWASSFGVLAIVAVLSALYPVVCAVLAYIVHKERLTKSQLLGVALTMGGIIAISF